MANSPTESKVFSVRIVSIDYYMAPPIPDLDISCSTFQGGIVNEVPVIRVYGSTPAGQKTCLYIHRALPYLYVPYSELLLQPKQEGDDCSLVLSHAVEKALKLKGKAGSKRQHVHGCSLVRARKFYGYHPSEELFVKIYLYPSCGSSQGAILNKVLQPYESHIPFLLQFLIDYNLYGMGHLHLSKLKFRDPVPDIFTPRKTNKNGNCRQETDSTPMAVDSQADSSGDECFDRAKWISSTIPDGWIWKYSSPSDSQDQYMLLIKRQSTCELEGDAVVDDILNQQSKLYTSLSQTNSEFNMVQSLIPIWEEFERTGIVERAAPANPEKPLPEDVLKTLSHGLDLENKLRELCSDAEQRPSSTPLKHNSLLTPSVNSSTDDHNLAEVDHVNSGSDAQEPLKCFKADEDFGVLLSGDVQPEEDGVRKSVEGQDAFPNRLSYAEVSGTIRLSNPKATDQEMMSLLKWLASSQASEDIDSDDELVREIILSPLFPAMDKMLQKANMEYENESQQECQDILDSVEDVSNLEGSKGRFSHSSDHLHLCQISSNKTIPQVDGSGDDHDSVPFSGKSSHLERDSEPERPSSHTVENKSGSSITGKHKRKKPSWGSLHVSSTQRVNNNLKNMTDRCGSEMKDVKDTSYLDGSEIKDVKVTSSWSGNTPGTYSGNLMVNLDNDHRNSKEKSTIVGCSVRDLMRKRRCYWIESSECKTSSKVASENKEREDCINQWNDKKDKQPFVSPICRPLLNYELTKLHERNEYSANSTLELCYEACDVKSNSYNGSMYGKLPLISSIDSSLEGNTSKRKHLPCEGHDGEVITGQTAGSGSLRITNSSPLHSGSQELPQFLDVENQKPEVLVENCTKRVQEESIGTMKSLMPNSVAHIQLSDNDSVLQTDAVDTSCPSTCMVEHILDTEGYTCQNGCESNTKVYRVPHVPHENLKVMEGAIERTLVQPDGWNVGQDVKDIVSSGPCSSVLTATKMEMNSVDLIGMSLCKKSPVIDSTGKIYGTASVAPGMPASCCPWERKSYEGSAVQDRIADECLPFFRRDFEGGEGIECRTENINHHQDAVMDAPPHYQNDRSFLYMLTPVISPPSIESVQQWLLLNATVERGDTAEPAIHSSLQATTCNPLHSEGLLEHSLEVPSLPNAEPELEVAQINHQNEEIPCMQMKSFHSDVATVQQGMGIMMTDKQSNACSQDISQISGPDGKSKLTPLSQIGFRDPEGVSGGQQLTLVSIEVLAESRGDLRPDPRFDAINVIVFIIQEDDDSSLDAYIFLRCDLESDQGRIKGISNSKVLVCSKEKHLFCHFMRIICSLDPDVLMGWDIQGSSLGYLAERAAHLGIALLNKISRTPSEVNVASKDNDVVEKGILHDVLPEHFVSDPVLCENAIIEDEWGRTHVSGVHVGGRVVLNVWRLMRGEVKLTIHTIEAVAEAVLRQKIPFIHYQVLTKWFSSGHGRARYRCIEYILERAKLNLQIMNQLDMINRTSELARVFGIDFFSVLSRGSQYRVESMFLRLAHTQNYLAISPGNQQVASQPAMECIPLVMEPESGFYADPVVVLDFQSLYPSMIIAYNLCFSTCLGKASPAKMDTLGVASYAPELNVLHKLKHQILLTPNGVMYVPSRVRKGILPHLLDEILLTRIMVKQAMKKLAPTQVVLHRIFNARQLALKLIANVTYGYTAAGFSGRMPCAELADSIVQCARRTLENAISLVNTHEKWKAKVIYGDTDSMFVLLRGRSVKESFQIGHEIASAVTTMNPNPVTLKMEKVYHPCFLLTKKRYVGYSYESPDQINPVFDAKGIETVRRDSCGAVSKTMEQSLKLFFEHQDINKVKTYVLRQWKRILSGRVSLQDFVFAKEVRLGTYSTRVTSLPPAAIVAIKAMRADPRAEPKYAERIPYVVVHGEPGARLVDMVVDPLDLLAIESPFRLNDLYYINKQIIPALQRVFGLVGADLNQWFLDMPRTGRDTVSKRQSFTSNPVRRRIDYYYVSKHCILCGELVQTSAHLCWTCSKNESLVATAVIGRTSKLEREIQHLAAICRQCGGGDWLVESGVKCTSLACSVFYERRKIQKELQSLSAIATETGFYPRCMVEWF